MKPLVLRFGALGDMVMITPALRCLAERSGQKCDVIGIGNWLPELYKELPWVDTVYTIGSGKSPYWLSADKKNLIAQLKTRSDYALYLLESGAAPSALIKKTGWDVRQHICGTQHPTDQGNTLEHSVDYFLRLAQLNTANVTWPQTNNTQEWSHNTALHVSTQEIQECTTWLQSISCDHSPLILIQAGNKKTMGNGKRDRASNIKYWPEEKWASVIQSLRAQKKNAKVLLCGVPSEQEMALDIVRRCNDPDVISVADQLPLRRLMALMTMAHSCISVDTGPAHIGAALNCPLVVLFAKTHPARCRPINDNCHIGIVSGAPSMQESTQDPETWAATHCMDDITPENVVEEWLRIDNG